HHIPGKRRALLRKTTRRSRERYRDPKRGVLSADRRRYPRLSPAQPPHGRPQQIDRLMPENPAGFRNFEHQGWQKAAARYGRGFGDVTSQAIGPLLDAVGASASMRLLDVACGPGYAAAAAAERGCRVTGIDFSSEMIAIARAAYPNIEFREGD